jgi:hypothetical protein
MLYFLEEKSGDRVIFLGIVDGTAEFAKGAEEKED